VRAVVGVLVAFAGRVDAEAGRAVGQDDGGNAQPLDGIGRARGAGTMFLVAPTVAVAPSSSMPAMPVPMTKWTFSSRVMALRTLSMEAFPSWGALHPTMARAAAERRMIFFISFR
jgi:hypothetical protein